MNHKVHLFQVVRIETDDKRQGKRKRSKWCYDIWDVSIDGIEMEMMVYSTIKNMDVDGRYNIRLSNRLVSKHKDYKKIREEIVRQLLERYDSSTHRQRAEISA